MLEALRYRRAQAAVLIVLSALVTTCLVFAPLYTRALEQATVRTLLSDADPEQAGLRLASASSTDPALALDPNALTQLVPESVRGFYGAPVHSIAVDVRRLPLLGEPGGRLLSRDGACDHVRITDGRCPSAAGEVTVSRDQARAYDLPVGASLDVGEFDAAVSSVDATPRTTLRVVGVYEPVNSPYWFGDRLTGQASQRLGFDTMLTASPTVTGQVTGARGGPAVWFEPQYAVDLPLMVDRVGIDEIAPLGSTVAQLVEHPMGVEGTGSRAAETITVRSGVTALAAEAQVGSAQAAVTIPLLMAQLGLLLGCVLWLVLVAAADQRSGEVAIARLRGRGSRGARRLLLGESLPPLLIGVPLGILVAGLACSVARHTVLTGDTPFEVPPATAVVLVLGVALMGGLALLSVRRVCLAPVATLLRSVPARPSGIRLGVLEAMLVASAVGAFVAVVTGSVGGSVGQVAPTLLALAVGVVAARVIGPVLAAAGRRLLRRGHPNAGAAFLTASRRGMTRWLVPVVTVALSIVVVTAGAFAVGERNWTGRAEAEVGAASVLSLDSVDLAAVSEAVRAVDPAGDHVTPVAVLDPGASGGTTTIGVIPAAFRRIALWPGVDVAALPLDRLTAPTAQPLLLRGTRLTYHVAAPAFRAVPPAIREVPTSLALALRVVHADGTVEPVSLGALPAGGVDTDQEVPVACADGCRLTGIGVLAPRATAAVSGAVTLSRLGVDGRAVDLGGSTSWRDVTDAVEAKGSFPDGGVTVTYTNDGFTPVFLTHASVPDVVPALTTAAATPSASGATFAGSYVDGGSLPLRSTGGVTFVPGGPAAASLVNLDNLLAQQWRGRGSAHLTAYVDSTDPAYLAQVASGLTARGIGVVRTNHAETFAASYARTAAAWSLQLALAVGLLSLLAAAVAIVVLGSTSSRARRHDYAALRLVGARSRGIARVAQLETGPVIAASAVLGGAVGLWAAAPAVALVPLFASPPTTFPVDLRPAWGPGLLAGLVGLVVLGLVGAVTSRYVARRADVQRLRESG